MTTKRPTKNTLAEALKCSVRHVHSLIDQGMPSDSVEAAVQWRTERTSSVERLRRERIDLVREQRRRIELENKRLAGQLVDRREEQENVNAVCSVARAKLIALEHHLPPRLAGLGEAQMQAILRGAIREILDELSRDIADLGGGLEKVLQNA